MKPDEPNEPLLDAARALVKRGEIDRAVRAFLGAGAFDEAATALAGAGRFAEAGHLLMDALGVGAALVGGLDAERKKLAVKAAVWFAQAGETKRSVELYLALGDPVRAAELLERSGDVVGAARVMSEPQGRASSAGPSTGASRAATNRAAAQRLERAGQLDEALRAYLDLREVGEAARVAQRMGRFAEAGQLYDEAGKPYEAAACFLRAGDTGRCLECIVRIPPDHDKYRAAAVEAIRLASELNALDFKLDHFLTRFMRDAPQNDREAEALYVLAKLYRARDFAENAREAYQKILRARPDYRDVAAKLAELDAETRGSHMVYDAIVREEQAFRQGGARAGATPRNLAAEASGGAATVASARGAPAAPLLPDLPDLPELPGLPPLASGPSSSSPRTRAEGPGQGSAPSAPEPARPADLQPQLVIHGRYRLDAKLGEGGMAVVYRATDLELGETIAMKFFTERTDEEMIARFKQELTLSRQLAHPNVVRLYDLGTHDGSKFITMELLEGRDLAAMLDGRPMDLGQALNYLVQACQGLAAAHERGIIHRDIKPANFFVTHDGVLKVMDFGIAKARHKPGVTRAGFMAGTPEYMSPEQISNFGAVTHLSDLYSLGIVAYELATGTVPFTHEELMSILRMHMMDTPPPPSSRNPSIPAELEDIILRLLAKEPAGRIQSCRELATLLSELRPRARR